MRTCSLDIFRSYILRFLSATGEEVVDVSGVLSKEAFLEWVAFTSHKCKLSTVATNHPRNFQRALSGHLTGLECVCFYLSLHT
jgi:hypothetical protein